MILYENRRIYRKLIWQLESYFKMKVFLKLKLEIIRNNKYN